MLRRVQELAQQSQVSGDQVYRVSQVEDVIYYSKGLWIVVGTPCTVDD